MSATVQTPEPQPPEQVRTGTHVASLMSAILDNLFYVQGRFPEVATPNDWYQAVAYTVRDHMLHRWVHTAETYKAQRSRTVAYLSAEFLLGPHLANNLFNLEIMDNTRQAVDELRQEHPNCPPLDGLLELEEEPGLGNGGLGRLAACYLDSMATLQIPAIGYGIRYEFGIFDQEIRDGWQREITDKWLRNGNPWEIARPALSYDVPLGGYTEQHRDEHGRLHVLWHPSETIRGVAYDTPIAGYQVSNVNLLRLWKSEATESFKIEAFNRGDYWGAVEQQVASENISKVLYPNDEPAVGKELRLKQQYFFVSCSLRDMIRLHLQFADSMAGFERKFVVQLNDTHPSIAVAELMRLLLDEHGVDWDPAWEITRNTFAYTNHTLLPEALETWPVELFQRLLPRHLEIIYEINAHFLDEVRTHFLAHDGGHVERMSLIDEAGGKHVRMANLACVGSFAINGVAELHSELLKTTVLRDFYDLWPHKFSNKTNGVTPRRFVVLSNRGLARLVHDRIGCDWTRELDQLKQIEPQADDAAFQQDWRANKRASKALLAQKILQRTGVAVSPDSLFDIQAKRIHEYKRQHLNALHVISLYGRIKDDPSIELTPRTVIFAGKAAPSYHMAKLMIKLISSVAHVVNHDPEVGDRLKVVFFPDFNVKNGQRIYPAADLSEQISTAGKEASGTGNMKFALNGALTIGTLDGANIEIRRAVGDENFFLFGLTAEEVKQHQARGYRPWDYYEGNPRLKAAIDLVASGFFSGGEPGLFSPLVDNLLGEDPYMVLADFAAYLEAQEAAAQAYGDRARWTRMSILNVARMGYFSSDRAICEYCRDIWHACPVPC